MIVYLRNNEIDREKWDTCLSQVASVKPYAWSWYLDIMAPGWEAMVDDDYDSLFPIPCFRKYGYNYIATPVFLQQLGLISPEGDRERRVEEFIGFIPEFYRLVDLCIGQDINVPGFSVSPKTNFELGLRDQYDRLWFDYSTDCRRNINIAHRYPQDIVDDVRPHELISLFRNSIGSRAGLIREVSYRRLFSLMDFCVTTGKGRILGVRSPKGKLLWATFLIELGNRITMLFTAGSKKSRELRTAYHVIDNIVRENAGKAKILDFAGSSIPSVAVFMKSFGSRGNNYYRIYRNTLPWPLRFLK